VKGDPNLRARLERLASNAGDPPERGLERVAARRHRRLRRRLGAFVTAAALAVLVGTVSLVVDGGPDRRDVAVSPARRPTGAAAQLPDTVDVHCTTTGVEIPVASVRPQQDGMHVRVFNELAAPIEVWVVKPGDWEGRDQFGPGQWAMRLPAPPGSLRVGCGVNGSGRSLTVELNDVRGYYREPELECPADDEVTRLTNLPAPRPEMSMVGASKSVLKESGLPVDDLGLGPVRGYVAQRLGDPTDDPVVQVQRDGDTIAFVHLGKPDGQPEGPWTLARSIEGCQTFLAQRSTTATTAAPAA
jgi:hypothetical protein